MNLFDNMTNAFEQSLNNYKAGAGSVAQGKIQANEALTGGKQQLMRAGITAKESIGTSEIQSKIAEGSQKLMKELGIDLSFKPSLAGLKGFSDFAGGRAARWTARFQKENNPGLTTRNPTDVSSEIGQSDVAFDVAPAGGGAAAGAGAGAGPPVAGAGAGPPVADAGAGAGAGAPVADAGAEGGGAAAGGADMAAGAGAGDGIFGSVPTPFQQSADAGAEALGGESNIVSSFAVGGQDAIQAGIQASRSAAMSRAPAQLQDLSQGGQQGIDATASSALPETSLAPDIFPTLPSQTWGILPGDVTAQAGSRMGSTIRVGTGEGGGGGGAAASAARPPPATGGPTIDSTGGVTPAPAPTNPATQTQQPNQSFDDDPDVMDSLDTSRWAGGGGGAPDESLFNPPSSTAANNLTEEASGLADSAAAEVSTLSSTLIEGAGTVLSGIGGAIGDILPVVGPILAGVGLFEGFHKLNKPFGDAGPDPYAGVRATLADGQSKLNMLGTQISADQFATKVGAGSPAFGSLAAPTFNTSQQMGGATDHF